MFHYCSGGERTVKCVRPALEMEANKEEQRGVVSFLVAESGILSDRIILLHDNTHPHNDNQVRDKLQRFGSETLHHHHPYSPDLSPCDFHVFGDLKKYIHGSLFHSDEEVQEWVRLWLHQRPTSFYKSGIDRLVSQWDKYINASGNYF